MQLTQPVTSAAKANARHIPRRIRREQEGKKQQWIERQQKAAEVSKGTAQPTQLQKKGLTKLRNGQKFVLIFECIRKEIPQGIQILPLTGGKTEVSNQSDSKKPGVRISTAKVDLDGLLERVSVDSVNVTNCAGYVVAYINCTVGRTKDVGFNHWGGGVYEAFIKRTLSQTTWNKAIIKQENENRTTLTLRKAVEKQYETKIRFAVE